MHVMKSRVLPNEKLSPGRPRTFDHAAAVDAAMHLFWSRGFGATSAGDLADAMSIQRSSFYNTFGDRESAFTEAVGRYVGASPDVVLDQIPPDGPVVPVIAAMLQEACRRLACDRKARGCLLVNSMAELIGANPKLGPMLARGLEQRLELLVRLFKQAVARGEMRNPENFGAAARGFMAFLTGLNLMAKVVRDEEDLWQTCRIFLSNMGMSVPTKA